MLSFIKDWFVTDSATVAVAEQPETVTMPEKPQKIEAPSPSTEIPDGYKDLAKELGVSPSVLLNMEVRDVLLDCGLSTYGPSKVFKYMDALVAKERITRKDKTLTWAWKPLREVDKYPTDTWSWDRIRFSMTTYNHEVPYPVLLTVKKLVDRFGERAKFFVSDYESAVPDPFLLVVVDMKSCHIVERWDEPSFRG